MKVIEYEQKSISIKALIKLIHTELDEFKKELSVGDDIRSYVNKSIDKKFVELLVKDFDALFSDFSDLYSLCLKIKHSAERTLDEEKWKQVILAKKRSTTPAQPQSVEQYLASLSPEVKAQMKARVMAVYGAENKESANPVENVDDPAKP